MEWGNIFKGSSLVPSQGLWAFSSCCWCLPAIHRDKASWSYMLETHSWDVAEMTCWYQHCCLTIYIISHSKHWALSWWWRNYTEQKISHEKLLYQREMPFSISLSPHTKTWVDCIWTETRSSQRHFHYLGLRINFRAQALLLVSRKWWCHTLVTPLVTYIFWMKTKGNSEHSPPVHLIIRTVRTNLAVKKIQVCFYAISSQWELKVWTSH